MLLLSSVLLNALGDKGGEEPDMTEMAFGMTKYGKMNLCASAVAVLIFALAIAAASNPWYYYSQQFVEKTQSTGGTIQLVSQTVNSSTVDYDLDGFTQTNEVNGAISVTAYQYSQRGSNAVRNIFRLVMAFTYLALIAVFMLLAFLVVFFADRLRNKIIFAIGMSVTRFVILGFAVVAVISFVVAFLGFLGIREAFQSELTTCNDGPCQDFVKRTESEFKNQPSEGTDTSNIRQWGPTTGWYLTAANMPLSLVLLIVVALNKFPMPIDSDATSGEAL